MTARSVLLVVALGVTLGGATDRPKLREAVGLYQRGQFLKAAAVLKEEGPAAAQNAEVHYWLGKACLKAQRLDEAVRELEAAAELEPSSSQYHRWLGHAYGAKAEHSMLSGLGLARKVREQFEIAVRLDPKNLNARFDLLEFYASAPGIAGGSREKAEAEAREIAALNTAQGYPARALIYAKKKNWEATRREYEGARAEYPNLADAAADLAEFLVYHGDPKTALDPARAALRLDPKSLRARMLVAAAQAEVGTALDQSERTLMELAGGALSDDDPSFAEVYYWLGRTQEALGKTAEAREAFQRALAFEPDHSKAKEALARLR